MTLLAATAAERGATIPMPTRPVDLMNSALAVALAQGGTGSGTAPTGGA